MFLNWPEAVVILGCIVIAVFRAPLSRLIERTEKVKDWLVAPKQQLPALPAAEADQSLPTRNREEEQRGLEQLTKDFDNALLLIQEDAIRADLAKAKLVVETGTLR
jgi:hypothetical protein